MFMVIESTPGYLSEDDDPPVFDSIGEAREYAKEALERLLDHIHEGQSFDIVEAEVPGCTVRGDFDLDTSVLVYDNSREHDLGRIIEIVPTEPQ